MLPLLLVAMVFSFAAESSPDLAHPLIQALVPTLWIGGPLAMASVILVRRMTDVADGPDVPARLLSITTSGLPGTWHSWGQAMRAELESVEGDGARRRFALGCSLVAMRAGFAPRHIVVGGATALLISGGALAASRVMFAGSRVGLFAYTLLVPQVLLFLSSAGGASLKKSFRDGLMTGSLAFLLALIVILGVAVVEAQLWYDSGGIFILDGDTPPSGTSRTAVILNPLSPHFVLLHTMVWLPMLILGAAAGSRRPNGRRSPALEAQGSSL